MTGSTGDTSHHNQPEPDNAWRDLLCRCQDEAQHIHCPWGGAHVHYVDDDGYDIQPPAGSRLRAVVAGRDTTGSPQ